MIFSEKSATFRDHALIAFAEPSLDQRLEGLKHRGAVLAGRGDGDRGAGPRGQHHQPHNRGAADGFTAAADPHLGVEFFHGLDEFRRSPRVQPLLVDDLHDAHECAGRRLRHIARTVVLGRLRSFAHFPASTRLAMVMYFLPDSCAAATASASGHSSRTLASLISIGRLMPASTSTLGRLITDMARLEGVPPNMSVRMATPSPLSTRLTASRMFLRHCSTSSSGPMVTASIWRWGPTTCSSAERNSMASRPWVTSTRPIIPNSSRALRCAARTGPH